MSILVVVDVVSMVCVLMLMVVLLLSLNGKFFRIITRRSSGVIQYIDRIVVVVDVGFPFHHRYCHRVAFGWIGFSHRGHQ
jgi:hypothetical protein